MTIELDQSELTIVNAMLSCIGDLPVEDLANEDVASDADVLKARSRLKQLMIHHQTRGWWFNTEIWTFTPDSNGYITLPPNTLRIRNEHTYIKRGTKLYDVINHTLIIDEDDLDLELVLLFDFNELPISFFNYIKALARYEFFAQEDGDKEELQTITADLRDALTTVQDEDLQFRNSNILVSNPTVQKIFSGWANRRA